MTQDPPKADEEGGGQRQRAKPLETGIHLPVFCLNCTYFLLFPHFVRREGGLGWLSPQVGCKDPGHPRCRQTHTAVRSQER